MSYNISVKFDGIKTPHVRWHWVRRGIELIRDQGLDYTPHSAHLYHELAWHFQHKVGHNLDDAHRFYKLAWCTEMMHDPCPDGRPVTEDDIFEGGVIGGRRDGYLDLIFGGHLSPDILIFRGGPDGFDTENPQRIRMERDGAIYDSPLWIYLAELTNDGWQDLVVPQSKTDRSLILWGGPDGFSMDRCQLLSVWKGVSARAAERAAQETP